MPESEHRAAVCLRQGGRPVLELGDVDSPRLLRSTAKPFQALAALEVLLEARFHLEDAEIAVVSASHSGQPLHVDLVRGLLRRGGLDPEVLQCGPHAPLHAATRRALLQAGEAPGPLHNNCSGKHAAMLLACRLRGWDTATYLDPGHPLQMRVRRLLALFMDLEPEELPCAVDGCGAPAFAASLSRTALAFERLGCPGTVAFPEAVWSRWLRALPAAPEVYAGEGELCTRLLQMGGGSLIPKIGAEAFYAAAGVGSRFGLALKVLDGSGRALEPLVAALLHRHATFLGDRLRGELAAMTSRPLVNHAGLQVGRLEACLP